MKDEAANAFERIKEEIEKMHRVEGKENVITISLQDLAPSTFGLKRSLSPSAQAVTRFLHIL